MRIMSFYEVFSFHVLYLFVLSYNALTKAVVVLRIEVTKCYFGLMIFSRMIGSTNNGKVK